MPSSFSPFTPRSTITFNSAAIVCPPANTGLHGIAPLLLGMMRPALPSRSTRGQPNGSARSSFVHGRQVDSAQPDWRVSDLNWTAGRGHDFGPSLGRVLSRNEGLAQATAPLEIVKSRPHPVCKGEGVSPFMLRSYRTCSGALLVRWAWRHTADDIPIFGSTTRAGRRS